MKLEIGCGDRPREGFTNLDFRELPGVDIVDDATKLTKIEDNSCEEIRAVQVLEHFSHLETLNILKVWFSKLKEGGILHIEVPDMRKHCEMYMNGQIKEPWAFVCWYGGQDYEGNYHKAGFSVPYLTALMKAVGCTEIENLMEGKDNMNCEIKLRGRK